MRYFTLEEAQALIPRLEDLFVSILTLHTKAEARARRIEILGRGGNARVDQLALENAQLQFLVGEINDWFDKIRELGALPKGIEPALVDFPCLLSGREVYLCWRLGEKSITHYHGLEEGFAGRKALPRAASPAQEAP